MSAAAVRVLGFVALFALGCERSSPETTADVEPVHARIHRAGEGYEIEDGKTPSGTYINGRKVSRQRLNSQDQIRIGSTVLLYTMKED